MRKHKPKLYWLIHHGRLLEWSTEPIYLRRAYVKGFKPQNEQDIRLKWMRPVKRPDLLPKATRFIGYLRYGFELAEKDWKSIVRRHKKECPGCPFDYEWGTLIFPKP